MSRTTQIRNLPEALHRRLEARAARAGLSLSDYRLDAICDAAERPTLEEMRARLKRRAAIAPSLSPAAIIRAQRGPLAWR